MNFSRKTILVVGAALLAACGDKVTVQEYTPPATVAKVNSVSVAPTSATLNIGQTITLTAAVNADAGLATTVTWAASASNVTVSTAGVVTAVSATPGVAVCATSTVDTGKKGCATIVVSPVIPTIPATVSINSITATGNLNTTVNPAAVAGGIDVTLNVNPGNQTISKVELLIGSVIAGTQTFTAAQAAALRFAADEAVAAQSTFPQVVFSVNTAAFNATTGVPVYMNGPQAIQAKVYVGTATAASASVTQNLTFANVDGFAITTSGGTSAVDANGYRWTGNGSLTVNALPVMYSGSSIGTVFAALGANTGCAAVGNVGSATTKTGNVYVITGTMAGLQSGAGCTTTSPNLIGITATNSAGDNLTLANATAFGPGVLGTQTGLRWDNVAPAPVAGSTFAGITNAANIRINVNPNGRANRWINDAVVLNGAATTATSNNFLCSASAAGFNTCVATDTLPRDAGVGGAVYMVQVGATKAAAIAAAPITSVASLAPSATNAGYCAVAYTADALGNKTAFTTAQAATACGTEVNNALIGVDRAAPTIAYTAGSIAANARLSGGTVGGEFIVTVNDTGLVGNSGMLPGAPVLMTINRRAAGTTPNSAGTNTLRDATGAATVTALSATGVAAAAPLYSTSFTGITGAANHAYWTHNATAYDAAGNSASVSPRTMVYDATAPAPGAPSAQLTLTAIGYSTSAFINEDLDIQDYFFTANYGAAPVIAPANISQAPIAVNGFNAATFSNTNFLVTQAVNLPLGIQANVAAGVTAMANLVASARSQSNLAGTSGVFTPTTVTPGTAISTTNMTTFAAAGLPAGVTGIVTGNTTAASAGGVPLASSAVITVNVVGTTAIFNNPFASMNIYMLDATGATYRLVATSSSAVLNDNGATRTYTYSFTIPGTTLYSTLLGAGATFGSQILAVGMNASGNIGMVAAGLTAVNVTF